MDKQEIISFTPPLLLRGIFAVMVWMSLALSSSLSQTPCKSPISIQVGDIDPHFMISEEAIIDLLDEVQELWSTALHRKVVQYDADDGIPIHFIYGKEQRSIQERQMVEDHINHQQTEIAVLQTRYDSLYAVYQELTNRYEKTYRKHNKLMDEYNESIEFTNVSGGISNYENQSLKALKKQMTTLKGDLHNYDQELDTLLVQINDLGNQINSMKTRSRERAKQFNQVLSGSKAYFQGKYISDTQQPEIQIYHFENIGDLKLVLAHEIGHALGIGHVNNPHSIMYYFRNNQTDNQLKLSDYDIRALQKQCLSVENKTVQTTL